MLNLETYPTIKQVKPHFSTSDRYGFISSDRICSLLGDLGWYPHIIQENKVRRTDKIGFQKHMIRFTNPVLNKDLGSDSVPEIVAINAHDLSGKLELFAGIFRMVCLNGMLAGTETDRFSITHLGYTDHKVELAVKGITDILPGIAQSIERFKAIELNDSQRHLLAKQAIDLRFNNGVWAAQPNEVLAVNRYEDKDRSLWHAYNVIQENLIRGCKTTTVGKRQVKARAIKSIDRDIDINRKLWDLTANFANEITAIQ